MLASIVQSKIPLLILLLLSIIMRYIMIQWKNQSRGGRTTSFDKASDIYLGTEHLDVKALVETQACMCVEYERVSVFSLQARKFF